MSAQFFQNIHVCTVYTNLGEDGILHAMNETQCSVVVTSHDLMPKFDKLLAKLPHVTHLIYFEVSKQEALFSRYSLACSGALGAAPSESKDICSGREMAPLDIRARHLLW